MDEIKFKVAEEIGKTEQLLSIVRTSPRGPKTILHEVTLANRIEMGRNAIASNNATLLAAALSVLKMTI